ncbi:hypothetical protein RDI58_011720 [Solanum bulbocastanum]|uniref:Receptor-like serine/threonine-protein kinase n=1 Tax=Solanum bulbocastanum TaxID=147425 RepID=A0AAN8YGJ1_SOLBU
METFLLTLHILLCGFVCSVSSAKDIITATDFLTDGKTITSSDGSFEMGFFTLASFTNNWYVGIWYKHNVPDKSVVWVANRANPFTNTSGVRLKIIDTGQLALLTADNKSIWSTNSSRSLAVKNTVAQLLNSGNLAVRDASDTKPEKLLWQSFDYPTDTLLPGMKMGKNFVTGQEFYLSSWKKESDPAPGEYTYHCDPTGYPQNVVRKGKVKVFNTGPWNGLRWSGVPGFIKNTISTFKLDFDEKEAFYSFTILGSVMSKLTIKSSGELQISMWVENRQEWQDILSTSVDTCDNYGTCGAYGSCNNTLTPSCSCLDTFVPKDPNNWATKNWSSGCVRRKPLNCQNGDGFLKYSSIKLPDTQYSWFDVSMTLGECKQACLGNCSCMAYSNLDIRNGGTGCLLWYGDLINIRELPGGQDIYIRVATSELGSKKTKLLVLSLLPLIGVTVTGLTIGLYIWKNKKRKMNLKDDLDLPLFALSTLTKASSNFSVKNKIGEGGFGSVYKGILEGGQDIAIKRLSKSSSQGVNEFKNEVIFIAKLQHRNLVKLIGCCIAGGEKILVYEYMCNGSLDLFIFEDLLTDKKRSLLLNWPKCFDIINGIARGLLYLHQDSRLRIIHRDLKASNILLDADMNPKISDFGIARSVVGNETGANTHHVVGTHGYMSPEYVVHGVFSVKSDVFSFGVLVLEIISGRRNRGFASESHSINLLGHVWKLYKEGRPLELIDGDLMDSSYISELLRLIHVALLCVQQCPEDRPDMATVILMLTNDAILPQAKEPGFFTERKVTSECSTSTGSTNEITVTQLEPR